MLRVVAAGGSIIPDPQARQPGRGAYLHPCLACYELAQRRRAFSRALRVPGSLEVAPLASYLSTLGTTENLYGKQVEKL
jgi:predicted RNA-binding protein YlxR (DUF448 family)